MGITKKKTYGKEFLMASRYGLGESSKRPLHPWSAEKLPREPFVDAVGLV